MSRDVLLSDAIDAFSKAKHLTALVRAAAPQSEAIALNAANESRLERALLHALDAIQSLRAIKETTCP